MSKKSFEENISRLEEIVKTLEQGETTLDQAILLFEEGVKITGDCNQTLENAKQKITLLTEKENGDK